MIRLPLFLLPVLAGLSLAAPALAASDAAGDAGTGTAAAKPDAPPTKDNTGGLDGAPEKPETTLARKWEMVPDKSSIAFHGKQMGTDFDGVIKSFKAQIYFDADHLDQSAVSVTLDLASVDAKDAERNKNIQDKDWFDTEHFPTARFETTKFTKTGDNAFTADANLTIRSATVPVQLPFTLEFSKGDSGKDQAVMTGKVTLDRSKFQLGQGDWADPSVIANEVPVEIKVTATSPHAAGTAADAKTAADKTGAKP